MKTLHSKPKSNTQTSYIDEIKAHFSNSKRPELAGEEREISERTTHKIWATNLKMKEEEDQREKTNKHNTACMNATL